MENKEFCHLHVHTEYSQLDGLGTHEEFIGAAEDMGFKYLAITDHGNIDGVINFQKACKGTKIKPIFGCELYIVPDLKDKPKREKRWHVTVLIKNQKGFENLNKMLTIANLDGFHSKPRIDYDLLYENCEGLVVMSACAGSFIRDSAGIDLLYDLKEKIPGDVYLEIMGHDIDAQEVVNDIARDLSDDFDMVATNDCHYIEEDDWEAHEVLLAVQSKASWDDPKRFKFGFKGLHLKSADDMIAELSEYFDEATAIEALENTILIAEKCCDFKIEKKELKLPEIQEVKGKVPMTFLARLCFDGYERKIGGRLDRDDEYFERYKREIELLNRKNFIPYFLIVWEVVNWCRENAIMTGPGRGSVGGSLIAYLLGITSVDPLKFGLLFERFISEARLDYPDIDLDFDSTKRELVKEHLIDLYGENRVAGVTTFQRMKGKNAIRDVARVFGVPQEEVGPFAGVIEDSRKGKDQKGLIEDAVNNTQEGQDFDDAHPEIVDFAIMLEGQIRSYGRHAAAMVISLNDLTTGKRGYFANRKNNTVINWEGEDAEYMGLIKLDCLGLKEIAVLSETRRLVFENQDKILEFEKFDLNNKKVLKEFYHGRNEGIFQFNSRGLTKLCQDLKINKFMQLAVANALYRPGTLRSGRTEEFVKRKNGKKWDSIHPKIDKLTKDTYGIFVYQEQVMMLVNQLAGLTLEDADKIRKIIGKSKGKEEILKFQERFIEGCQEISKLSEKESADIWKEIEEFGGYAFNLSHAVEYSLIGYWGQFCKVYFPNEFICANLTYGADDPIKKSKMIKEAIRLGLSMILPKVGVSHSSKWVAKDSNLYVPFLEVKGIGEKSAIEINKSYKSKAAVRKGFFKKEGAAVEQKFKGRLKTLLSEIGAFDPDSFPSGVGKYFDFVVVRSSGSGYPKLDRLLRKGYDKDKLEDILQGKIYFPNILKKKRFDFSNYPLIDCNDCALRDEASEPVLPSKGLWNVTILGEAPGKDEDRLCEGFVGSAGKDILWPELNKYNLKRRLFHISNIAKCYPSQTKTPNKKHILACEKWIRQELKFINCHLILAFGNTAVKFIHGRDSGIMDLSGKTEWIDDLNAWVCWCIHPASVLYNKKQNASPFKKGVKNFAETFKRLRGD